MKYISLTVSALAMAMMAVSCATDSDKWHIKGSIEGLSDSDALLLEGSNQGYWYLIDTIVPGKNGKFEYAHEPQGYPDIYRLRVGSEMIYFPIDSTETVTVTATLPSAGNSHTLTGSPEAARMTTVDSLINATAARVGAAGVTTDSLLKQRLNQIMLADPSGIAAYYIVSKRIGNRPLYNAANRTDRRFIGAVANAYAEKRPDDPRTNYLKNLYLSNRPSSSTPLTIEAKQIGAFEIELFDPKGKSHSLLDLAANGKATILSFTAYAADWSPAFNFELNKIYSKYKGDGLEIYQVSVDTDEYAWKEAAKNLPWITVLNNISDGGRVLRDYNVGSLPTTFVINRNGEIVERVLDIDDLEPAVRKAL